MYLPLNKQIWERNKPFVDCYTNAILLFDFVNGSRDTKSYHAAAATASLTRNEHSLADEKIFKRTFQFVQIDFDWCKCSISKVHTKLVFIYTLSQYFALSDQRCLRSLPWKFLVLMITTRLEQLICFREVLHKQGVHQACFYLRSDNILTWVIKGA